MAMTIHEHPVTYRQPYSGDEYERMEFTAVCGKCGFSRDLEEGEDVNDWLTRECPKCSDA